MQLPTLNDKREVWQRITRAVKSASPFRVARVPRFADSLEQPDAQLAEPVSHADPTSTLVDRMLQHGRQALLLRPELVARMTIAQREKARQRLCNAMALVPSGTVGVAPWNFENESGMMRAVNELPVRQVKVDEFRLDRLQVSNQQFQVFVNEGGYENESFWATVARKRIVDLVDRSGNHGPRFWNKGKCAAGLENHPVVGVSWYEADAFARWQGKRLPTDPEWISAASGSLATDDSHQPLYPWGKEPRTGVANLWGFQPLDARQAGTVATNDLPEGATDSGILQLLGNVWEWTSSDFRISTDREELILEQPRKGLRGGAFDTYFGEQATCQLHSGDSPFARKRNIGFRCAIDVAALALHERTSGD